MKSKSRRTRKSPRARVTSLPPIDEQQRYTIPEASAYLRQSVAKTYVDVKVGKIQLLKDANRSYICGTEIIRRSALPILNATHR
jgi:hypothetical protein